MARDDSVVPVQGALTAATVDTTTSFNRPPRSRLTLKDVATLAGVSRTTASRVLNGRGEVSPEVRARVERVIGETNYTPLASARSLVSQRTGLVGYVVPIRTGAVMQDQYFVSLLQALSRSSARMGLAVALFLSDDEADQGGLIEQVILPRRIDGLLMSAYHTEDFLLDRLADFDIPTVTLGPNGWPDRFGSVDVDNVGGGGIAAQHLAEIGCRQVALIGGPLDTVSGRDRNEGFRTAIKKLGLELPDSRIRYGDYSFGSGATMADELIDEGVDGIFVASDTMALGAIQQLRARGLRIPQDVAVVGFDDLPAAATSDPSLTTIRQPVDGVADRLLHMLVAQLDGVDEVTRTVLPVELIVRASTAR